MASLPPLPSSSRVTPCALCGQKSFEVLSDRDRRGQSLNTAICVTCGLVSHESIPTDDELAEYYAADYRTQYHGAFQPRPHHVLRAWQLGGHLVRKLAPHLKAQQRVFEVGAGIGATVKQFELAGMQAAGVEPHHGYRDFGRQKLRAALEPGVLEEVDATPWYDLVILHHVLEHLPHPLQALEHIRRMLRLGGMAYVEVPNLAGPHAAPGHQFHDAHIYNFTPATLTAVAAAAGFSVKQSFTCASDENIALLLVPDTRAHASSDFANNYREVRAQLLQHNTLSYYTRPRYLVQRVQRAWSQWADRVSAEQRLQPILQRCAQDRVKELRRQAA